MKLNKEQVDALTGKIYKELSKDASKERDEFLEIKVEDFKSIDADYLMTLYLKNKYLSSYWDYCLNKITGKFIDENAPETKKYPSKDEIKNEIILETIECESLDELIIKIKSKYD